MTERDDFDKIVEGLELDLVFPDEAPEPTPAESPSLVWSDDTEPVEPEEPFYRKVEPTPLRPKSRVDCRGVDRSCRCSAPAGRLHNDR